MSKDAYFFSHDSNAKDDPKCVLLIEQLGMEEYGIYWMLIETLRDQPGYKYPVSLLAALARRYNTTPEKVKTVVYNYGLFIVEDDNVFFSQSLVKRMIPLEEKRRKLSEAGQRGNAKRWGANIISQGNRDAIAVQSQVKESIADNSKSEKSKEYSFSDAIASLLERERFFEIFFFKNYNDPAGEVERFCANYEATGWIRKNGTKAVDRLALARTWTQLEASTPKRFPPQFLEAWKVLYVDAKKRNPEACNALIFDLKGVEVNTERLTLICMTDAIQKAIEGNTDYFRPFFQKYFPKIRVSYRILNQ